MRAFRRRPARLVTLARWCSSCALRAQAPSDLGVELRDGQHVHLRLRWQPPREPEVELYDDATTPTTPLGASLPEAPRLGEQNAAGASRPSSSTTLRC